MTVSTRKESISIAIHFVGSRVSGKENIWHTFVFRKDCKAYAERWRFARRLPDLLMSWQRFLLHAPNSLTPGERELIATYVSSQNECYFCQTVPGAIAAAHLGGDEELVRCVKAEFNQADISEKLKALLVICARFNKEEIKLRRQMSQLRVLQEQRTWRFTTRSLIAAAFCMYNRYVDGPDTWQPHDDELYRQRGRKTAKDGYVTMSREYVLQQNHT